MIKKIGIVLIVLFSFGCSSTSLIGSDVVVDSTLNDDGFVESSKNDSDFIDAVNDSDFVDAVSDSDFVESAMESDRFLSLFNEAKIHFADALIALHENDTVEVALQLKLTFESLSDIEVFNNLDEIEYKELKSFTNRLIFDFKKFVPDDAKIHDQFTVIDMRESMEYLAEDYISTGSDQKIKIIEDRDGHIPIILNSRVQRIMDYFQSTGRKNFQIWLNRQTKYEPIFNKIFDEKRMPRELLYLSMIESGFKTSAYSYAYAVGQWQFVYATGKQYGLNRDYWVDERRDPEKATYAALEYLGDLYNYFGDWYLAMAAYNAGEGRIRRAIRYNDTRDFWKMSSLPKQTRNYVPTVLAAAIIGMDPEKYGFEPPKKQKKYEYDTLVVKNSVELRSIAKVTSTKYSSLKELNPELRRHSTPNYEYVLKIPKGQKKVVKEALAKNESVKKVKYSEYRVKRGDSLIKIGRMFNVSVRNLMSANNLKNRQPILIGQKLVIPGDGYVQKSTQKTYRNYSSSHDRVTYRVNKGDNLGKIAKKFSTSVSNLRNWNGLNKKGYIHPGQKLTVWTKKTNHSVSSSERKIIYTIKKGDTIGGIAEIYNTRASKIRKWNNFYYGKTIYPGQKIVIYVSNDSSSSTKYYTVRSGDSLERISKKTSVSVNKLKRLNPKISPSKIFPGDKIRIH